jgi:ATP-binding cassette subfamily F protein uup
MSDFIVENLSKSVGDKTVFQNISFIIHEQDRIGIIGVNGTGKTTLLDVLSGKLGFDGDRSPFSAKNDYRIAYLTQNPTFDETKSILDTVLSDDLKEMQVIREYENLMASYEETNQAKLEKVMAEMDALNAWEVESQVKTVLTKLGLTDHSQKVGDLSGGLRRRVQLAQTLLGKDDLLLLDEPTNHLDIDTIEWLQNFLKNSKKTVLFITHDRYFLDNVATRIFELDRASLTEYQGNYQDYVSLKAEQDERDAALRHKKEQLYKQELTWMRRQPQARATKQEARIHRFHDLKEDLSNKAETAQLEINFETSRIGKKVVEFEHVNFSYPGKPIVQDFSLLIKNADRIGIVGDNGKGKSTLLNLIAGQLNPDSGKVSVGETIRIGYFSQQIKGLDESKRVINFLQEVAEEAQTTSGMVSIAELLEQFLFPRNTHGTLIEKLSGGEKKRLYLLKILLERPNLLLLDEPTNDLDIATLTVLENFLQSFAGPVITVSHDRYFLDKVATKIIAFEENGLHILFGNYTDYLDEKKFLAEQENHPLPKKGREKVDSQTNEKQRMSYLEKQEWAQIEEGIALIEEKIAEIESDMQTCGSDFGRLSDLQKDLDQQNDRLLEKYERYEYLSGLEA